MMPSGWTLLLIYPMSIWPGRQAKTDLHLAARHKKLDYSLAARLQILLLFSKSLMVYFIVSKKALSASFFTALFLVVILLLC